MLSVLGITPFHRPDPSLATALVRAGARAAIDLGAEPSQGLAALERAAAEVAGGLGVRLHGPGIDPSRLPTAVEFVVLPPGMDPAPWRPRQVMVRVTSVDEAESARDQGADALVVAGGESPGAVGEETAFVLLQRVLEAVDLPLWVQGGIGPDTAAACRAAGARGIVLDDQLGLAAEASTPAEIRGILAGMDGSETKVLSGHRVFTRPDLEPLAPAREADAAAVAALLGPGPLSEKLVPLGQAAAFARPLAERHHTVAGIVGAIRLAAEDGVRAAREHAPLAEGSPLARDHGIRYPIFQGPMTRVSDQPGFARAVADGGGLPFLALSLLGGEPLRRLLEETAESVGDRPWGVGILGFVPAEKREEQLAAIEAVRPTCALIAGGRPSQAKHLEELGISTYLHVPSRGLLDLFLRQGARRFIFEGRECGGHVGPLSSFSLWQSQIDRLLEHPRPAELSVVFAGGIHDDRSAAMVSALAAPLAARGAHVGILMGTAYLFTREATETGAIVEGYQQEAITCGATVLLETAPGHATRCLDSAYVRAFLEEKARLDASGASRREMWAALEQMNLGRLRIASKGLVREGDELRSVERDMQVQEGMYMIGQIAALKRDVGTIADLHREVSEGSARRLAAAVPEVEAARAAQRETPAGDGADIAIVGMACIFPGAPDLESYWSNLVLGEDSVREVPHERWNPERYYDPDGTPGLTTPSKWGGFLGETVFDPARFGIPPRSIASIDPIQLLSLEVARRALEDAGYAERPFDRERTAVVFGAEGGTDLSKAYGFRAMWPQLVGDLPPELDDVLPVPTEDTFPGVLTNVISGRIANRLDLGGENYTVNAACASSLAALSIAVGWLRAGECDMVLVGGADVHNSIGDFLMFSSVHALSPGGRCRTFDQKADGIALGEGVGVIVIKRATDAARDGDRVYAVVEGIGGSSDGRSLGLTAPRREGQVRALERAYAMSGVSPSEVSMLEAHGTGTVVGDRTELQTLESIFGAAGAAPGTCALGSVKSQIGHTKGAAGVASVIKVALSLHRRVLPPTLHMERPNAHYDAERSPFVFDDEARPWVADRRVAGVSAFGFGGTNYHTVVAESGQHASDAATLHVWPAEMFVFRGPDLEAARARARRLRDLLDRPETPWSLRELARATSCGGDGPAWLAVVARDMADLRERIDVALEGGENADVFVRKSDAPAGRLAVLFPGQGSQYVGMLRQPFAAFPWLYDLLDRAPDVARTMHPPRAFTPAERAAQDARLTATETAQVAMGLCDLAMWRIVQRLGIEPDMVAGHSYGELVALRAAGVCGDDDIVFLSRVRARAILEAAGEDPGAMAAVMAGADQIAPHLEGLDVEFANLNAPRQTILSGPTAAIEQAVERLDAAGLAAKRLRVACAFHSKVVAGARPAYREALDAVDVGTAGMPVWCNATAAPYPHGADEIRNLMADQLACPVRFLEEIEAMYADGVRVFLETGPGAVLTGLVDKILGDRPHVAVPVDHNGKPGLVQLQRALARLAVSGVAMDLSALYEGRVAEAFDLASPPERVPAPTAWIVDGHYARPAHGEIPDGAYRPVTGPVLEPAQLVAPAANGAGAVDAREAAVLEYLRNVSQLVEAQKHVLLAYLGAPAPAAQIPAPAALAPAEPAPAAKPAPARRPAGRPAPAAAETPAPAADVPLADALLAIVAERTGYPVEMLDPDLDLEADLSIDSIKRIEILGTLSERVGLDELLGGDRDEALEELATIKTLRGIVQWLESRTGKGGEAEAGEAAQSAVEASANGSHAAAEAEAEVEAPEAAAQEVARYRVDVRTTPAPGMNGGIEGRAFAVTRDRRGVADALVSLLSERGARARVLEDGEALGDVDGFVHLASLSGPTPDSVLALYERAREALAGPAASIVGVTGMGGGFGHDRRGTNGDVPGGVGAFLKCLAKEWPEGTVRAIDVDADAEPARVAGWIVEEMTALDERLEVGRAQDARHVWELVPYEPSAEGATTLDKDSVVLVTGGARGIGARVSVALARSFGCRLELVGRTPPPSGEEPEAVAGIEDPVEMKRRLVEAGAGGPAEIERIVRGVLAAREVARTVADIRAAGGQAEYHAVDVRDEAAFAGVLASIVERHGRLDGAIHAAGCIEDRPLLRKSRESFLRVFDTKVRGALTILRHRPDSLKFVVFFSSMSSLFGNPGQTDYASANEVLDKLALAWNGRGPCRVLSINWGPWDGPGMVDETLRKSFERRGVGLLPPDRAVELLLDEIVRGDADVAQLAVAAGPVRRGR